MAEEKHTVRTCPTPRDMGINVIGRCGPLNARHLGLMVGDASVQITSHFSVLFVPLFYNCMCGAREMTSGNSDSSESSDHPLAQMSLESGRPNSKLLSPLALVTPCVAWLRVGSCRCESTLRSKTAFRVRQCGALRRHPELIVALTCGQHVGSACCHGPFPHVAKERVWHSRRRRAVF